MCQIHASEGHSPEEMAQRTLRQTGVHLDQLLSMRILP